MRAVKRPTQETIAVRLTKYVGDGFEGSWARAAEAIGCDYDQLWRVGTARTLRPSPELLMALAKASGRPVEWWLTGKGDA